MLHLTYLFTYPKKPILITGMGFLGLFFKANSLFHHHAARVELAVGYLAQHRVEPCGQRGSEGAGGGTSSIEHLNALPGSATQHVNQAE